jgi:hypothetical protein
MSLDVLYTRWDRARYERRNCSTCRRRRRMLGKATDSPASGWLVTCLSCGEQWLDRARQRRPCEPRWRARRIAAAKLVARALLPNHPWTRSAA